jgi:integrase
MKSNVVDFLMFRAKVDFVTSKSPCFYVPSFPPPPGFAMSVDRNGNVISKYGDEKWDFKVFGSKSIFYFEKYDDANKALFKKIMFYIIYSRLYEGGYHSLRTYYQFLQNIFKVCVENKIYAEEVKKYPKLIEEIASKFAQSTFNTSTPFFHKLLQHKDFIGHLIYDERSIALHSRFNPKYEGGQNAYIPPRIWTLFIKRLDEVLNDFIANKSQIEIAYKYICNGHIKNKQIRPSTRGSRLSPFNIGKPLIGLINYGADFDKFAKDYEIYEWLQKYSDPALNVSKYTIRQFQSVLNNTVTACYMYVLYYSIMRKSEVESLHDDCLQFEYDELWGKVPIISGETTKTDPDSDARWIVSKRVEKAVSVAKNLLEWKSDFVKNHKNHQPLFQRLDIWSDESKNKDRKRIRSAEQLLDRSPKFFNLSQFTITQEDYSLALAMTPSLLKEDWFKVGGIWCFGFHQFRRTLAVMFALSNVSSSTSQFQMKHGTIEQQFHYMNNYTKLGLNDVSSQLVINEFYNQMAKNLTEVVDEDSGKISPYGKTPGSIEIVNLLRNSDIKKLTLASREGKIKFRKNLLGGCMNQEECEYGGVDSITHCSSGSNGNMCSDLIIDTSKHQEFLGDIVDTKRKLKAAPDQSPLSNSLKAELAGYKKVVKFIEDKSS